MPSCSCSICGISKVAAIGTAFLLMSSQPAAAHRASRSESGKGVRSLRSLLAADDHAGHDHHDHGDDTDDTDDCGMSPAGATVAIGRGSAVILAVSVMGIALA